MPVASLPILRVISSPISGGGFSCQLGLLGELTEGIRQSIGVDSVTESDYTPHICLGASGGNVTNFLGLAAGWTKFGLHNIVKYLDSEIFSRSWWPEYMRFLPTWLLGITKGSIFAPGYGPKPLLAEFFKGRDLLSVEMWTGTFNTAHKMCELFCNKSFGTTLVSPQTFSGTIVRTLPLTFLDGDLGAITDVAIASASVPIVFGNKKIGDTYYEDGGVIHASPLAPLAEELYKIVNGISIPSEIDLITSTSAPISDPTLSRSPRRLHLYYISSNDLDDRITSGVVGDTPVGQLLETINVLDRNAGIELIVRLADGNRANVHCIHADDLSLLSTHLRDYDGHHYYLYMYSKTGPYVNMTSFTGEDILRVMEEARVSAAYTLYYI